MINLEPIAKQVQKRLFEKMRALGRETSYSDSPTNGLTQQEMMSRTTFIRMSSNQENPVILMGGEILPDTPTTDSEGNITIINNGKLAGGYDDLYSSRGYMDNPNKRPLPGIKSIDVSFKGGARASREATINWTCWSFEDIDRLTPHFLAHGKQVLLDWGWIYNKSSLLKLQNLMSNNGLSKSAFEDYSEEIKKGGGDFDSIVGIIKNFEYTTRSDGAFDCQTIIGSLGVSLLDNTLPDQTILDGGNKVNVTAMANTKEGREKLKSLYKSLDSESAVLFDVNISMKTFMSKLDFYFIEQINKKYRDNIFILTESDTTSNVLAAGAGLVGADSPKRGTAICAVENKFLVYGDWIEFKSGISFNTPLRQAYVRWGWFEDNVLSKFTSITSDTDILSRFRSIDGNNSVKIRNSKYLETIDFNTYILPGQTSPIKKRSDIEIRGKKYEVDGDSDHIIKLAEFANEYFSPFYVEGERVKVPSGTVEGPNGEKVYLKDDGLYYNPRTDVNNRRQYGYLRNMLVNTKVIKNAFEEIIGLPEAMDKMFTSLNTPINYWSFELQTDPDLPNQARIVDTQHTAIDFTKPLQPQRSVYSNGEMLNNGIFFFPVWRHDSIVKSQNLSAKVPTAMQLATMYGSNLDVIKYPSGAGITGETEGLALGGLYNEFADRNNKGLDTAFKNQLDIGNTTGLASEPLTKQGSDDGVFEFLVKNSDIITESVTDTQEKKEAKVEGNLELKYERLGYDESKPLPPLDRVTDEERDKLLTGATDDEIKSYLKIVGRKFPVFKPSINGVSNSYIMTNKSRDAVSKLVAENVEESGTDKEQSIILPLEMELEIDGTGGIYPGNSYHSTYLPQNYQDKTVFQIFDVNHTVSSTGWTTSISGKMRTSYGQVLKLQSPDDTLKDLIDNYRKKINEENNRQKAQEDYFDELTKGTTTTEGNPNPFNPNTRMYYDSSNYVDLSGEDLFDVSSVNANIGTSRTGAATFTSPWGQALETNLRTGEVKEIEKVDDFFGPNLPKESDD